MITNNQTIKQKKQFSGKFSFPGDKSIAHRLVLLTVLLNGKFEITNLPLGEDVQTSISIVEQLGVKVQRLPDSSIILTNTYCNNSTAVCTEVKTISDNSSTHINTKPTNLDCRNSGTTARLVAGILAGIPGDYILTGDASLQSRPMQRIIEPLERMGLSFSSSKEKNKLPLKFSTYRDIKPIDYTLPIASAQVKSSIIFATLSTQGKTTITEPCKSRDHTEKLLEHLGANINIANNQIQIEGPFILKGNYNFKIPGDPSSAAYFAIGALITSHSSIILNSILFNPTRTEYLNVLKKMGANIKISAATSNYCEPIIEVSVESSQLKCIEINASKIPLLIDELPILAVAMCFAKGKSKVTGANELRFKETDRISCLISELKKFGVRCCELDDGFEIEGPTKVTNPIKINSYGDHRLAMALSIISGQATNITTITEGNCVNISFPSFYNLLV